MRTGMSPAGPGIVRSVTDAISAFDSTMLKAA